MLHLQKTIKVIIKCLLNNELFQQTCNLVDILWHTKNQNIFSILTITLSLQKDMVITSHFHSRRFLLFSLSSITQNFVLQSIYIETHSSYYSTTHTLQHSLEMIPKLRNSDRHCERKEASIKKQIQSINTNRKQVFAEQWIRLANLSSLQIYQQHY